MNRKKAVSIVLALLAATVLLSCSDGSSSGQEQRGADVVGACSGHGGVVAFDDDAVICKDQTARDPRGSRAVDVCRGHRGVVAFDDDIVICNDQTLHAADEG